MATLLNEPEDFNEDSLNTDEELGTFNTSDPIEEQTEEAEQVEVSETVDDEVPDKYKGKSIAEIVRMHQEAEKLVGRQGTEVGELRKIVDDFVKANLNKDAHKNDSETEDDVDFFDNPKEAVNKAIASSPELQELKQLKESMKQQEIINKLNTAHPDWQDIVNTNVDFAEWVRNSNVRMELFQRANDSYDYDSADELLSTWKERNKAVKQASTAAKSDVKEQRKAASTGSAKGTGEAKARKIYRRSDIINLMRTDPTRYLELSDEITQAYAEGRVK